MSAELPSWTVWCSLKSPIGKDYDAAERLGNDLFRSSGILKERNIIFKANPVVETMKELLLMFLFAALLTSPFSQKISKRVFLADEYGLDKGALLKVDIDKSEFSVLAKCDSVEKLSNQYDDMKSPEIFASPTIDSSEIAPLHIIKYNKKGISTYYLYLNTTGSSVSVSEKGIVILFSDGTKMLKPSAKIDVDAKGRGNYNYSSFIILTPSDLRTLSLKAIKKFRLYIYDQEIEPLEALKFKDYVSVISND